MVLVRDSLPFWKLQRDLNDVFFLQETTDLGPNLARRFMYVSFCIPGMSLVNLCWIRSNVSLSLIVSNSPGAATPCLKKSDLTTCGTTRPGRSRSECLAFVEVLLWISWVILQIPHPTGDHSIYLWPFWRKSEVECPRPTDVSSV